MTEIDPRHDQSYRMFGRFVTSFSRTVLSCLGFSSVLLAALHLASAVPCGISLLCLLACAATIVQAFLIHAWFEHRIPFLRGQKGLPLYSLIALVVAITQPFWYLALVMDACGYALSELRTGERWVYAIRRPEYLGLDRDPITGIRLDPNRWPKRSFYLTGDNNPYVLPVLQVLMRATAGDHCLQELPPTRSEAAYLVRHSQAPQLTSGSWMQKAVASYRPKALNFYRESPGPEANLQMLQVSPETILIYRPIFFSENPKEDQKPDEYEVYLLSQSSRQAIGLYCIRSWESESEYSRQTPPHRSGSSPTARGFL